jgi:putative transposase
MRHTTFRFALDPTPAQRQLLARHAGASRFAYNQCLRLLVDARTERQRDPSVDVPWSGFDLINSFNAWKRSEAAGRVFAVASDGSITKRVTGLAWRHQVSAQVFEEAAIDLGRALAVFSGAKVRKRTEGNVGFPKPKRKGRCRDSFRLRNKTSNGGYSLIRIGDSHPRSLTLPRIGTIRVHDDTRRLRRMLRPIRQLDGTTGKELVAPRARILFATIVRQADRWYVNLTLHAPDLHPQRRHPAQPTGARPGFVGVDRGLRHFVVTATADGSELSRWPAPRSLTGRLQRLRDRSRAVSRKQRGSANRARAVRQLSREYAHIANLRRSFLHEVSGQLAKTHSRLVIEDLQVANLMANPRLARAIADAGWTVFARQLTYKAQWFGGELVVCDRWFPSTKTCHACGVVKQEVRLRQRVFFCDACGHACDRDRNAAANLAAWADRNHVPRTVKQAAGLPMPLEELAPPVGSPTACPSPTKGEPTLGLRPESRTSEKDGVGAPRKVLGAL